MRDAADRREESNATRAPAGAGPYPDAASGLSLGDATGRGANNSYANILADEPGAADHAVSARLQRRSHHAEGGAVPEPKTRRAVLCRKPTRRQRQYRHESREGCA